MERFQVYLIKPTRYDDEGYPLQWWRSIAAIAPIGKHEERALLSDTRTTANAERRRERALAASA